MVTMAADTKIGHGTEFWRWDGADYAQIGNVFDLSPPKLSRDTQDSTHYGSPERFREFISGLSDGGEATISIQYSDPAAMDAFITDLQDPDSVNYKLIWPDTGNTEWIFAAFVTDIEPTDPLDNKMTCDITFKLTGKPAFIS